MDGAATYEVASEMTSPDRRTSRPAAVGARRVGRRRPAASAPAVLLPAALMLVVGLVGLDRHSIWRDEAASLVAARRSLPELVDLVVRADTVHALYYALLHAWLALLPAGGVVWARVPSVLAMAVVVGLVVLLGARLASTGVGVVAGLLLVVQPSVSFYAQEARSPALVAACALLAAWCLLEALERPVGARRWWVAYAVACVLLVGMNLLGVLVPVALAVTVLLRRRPRRTLLALALATTPAALLVLGLLTVVHRQQTQISWIPDPGLGSLRDLAHLVLGASLPTVVVAGLLVLLGALPASRAGRVGWPGPSRADLQSLALPLLVLPSGVLLLASLAQPVFVPRYVVPSVAGSALLAAVGVERLARLAAEHVGRRARQASAAGDAGRGASRADLPRRVGVGVAAVLVVVLAVVDLGAQRLERTPLSRPDDLAAAAAAVAADARPGDTVLFVPDNRRLVAEVYPASFAGLDDVALATGPEETGSLTGRAYPVDRVLATLGSASRVWVLGRPGLRLNPSETTGRAELSLLERDFVRTAAPPVHGVGIVLFVRRGTA